MKGAVMARLLDPHDVQELQEGDTSVPEHSAVDHPPLTVPEEWVTDVSVVREQRQPIRWMRWLAFAGVLAAGAGVVAVLANSGDTVMQPDPIVEGDWDHLLLQPAAEGDWDYLMLPAGASALVTVGAAEGDWDHLMSQPAAEGDWDYLMLP